MIAVLDPDAWSGFRHAPIALSGEDGRYYLVTSDGAIPADGPRVLTQLDAAQLARVGPDHFTLRDGMLDAMPPANPAPVGAYEIEGHMHGIHFPGAVGLAGATGAMRLRRRLNLDFLQGEALDPRITFTRASGATRVNAAGLIEVVGNNVPRFDYDPVTKTARGLLIEEARTNLLANSGDQTAASWSFAGPRSRSVTGPDGTPTATSYQGPSAGPAVTALPIAATATTMTVSLFVKRLDGASTRAFLLRNHTTSTNFVSGVMDFDTGVISGAGWTASAWTDGWWRLVYTQTTGITIGDGLILYVGAVGSIAAYNGVWAVWGAQLEAGAFATSYIPTGVAAATRAADGAVISGTNFSAIWNFPEGTIVAEAQAANAAAVLDASGFAPRVYDVTGATGSVMMSRTIGDLGFARVTIGGVPQAAFTSGAWPNGAIVKSAFAWRENDFAFSINGAAALVDSSGAIPADLTSIQIGSASGWGRWGGHIRRLRYFPRRLSNAELQGLTA